MQNRFNIIKGYLVVCYWDPDTIVVSKFGKLYFLRIKSADLIEIYKLSVTCMTLLGKLGQAFRRLTRADIRFGVKLDDERLLVVYNRIIHVINVKTRSVLWRIKLPRGSRPLNILRVNEDTSSLKAGIYFGEYFSNPLKNPVNIYRLETGKLEVVYTFSAGKINHIHNMIFDELRDCVWILTGDFGEAANIYIAKNNFSSVEPIGKASQSRRACAAFVVPEGLLFATDSQFQPNWIKLLSFEGNSWQDREIFPLNGPSIFSTTVDDKFVFSTSVEAVNSGNLICRLIRRKSGPGIIKDQSEVVMGNLIEGFRTVYQNKKDIYPYILFQFGNIIFPSGQNDTSKLIFSNIALKENDLSTVIASF